MQVTSLLKFPLEKPEQERNSSVTVFDASWQRFIASRKKQIKVYIITLKCSQFPETADCPNVSRMYLFDWKK